MKAFTGPRYPTEDEYESVKKLIEYFMENYRNVEPNDDEEENLKKHKGKLATVAEVKEIILSQQLALNHDVIETDMLEIYANDLHKNILRDASITAGFDKDSKVRDEFVAAFERIVEPWSGPNTFFLLKALHDEVNLATIAETQALLSWYQRVVVPGIKKVFIQSKIDKFYMYNSISYFPLENKPLYSLFKEVWFKYGICNETSCGKATLDYFKFML